VVTANCHNNNHNNLPPHWTLSVLPLPRQKMFQQSRFVVVVVIINNIIRILWTIDHSIKTVPQIL